MKILRPFCMLAVGASLFCSAQQINPITRAMLNGYNEILQQNPKDYNTLYERAAQYYRISQYDNALNDLTKAIEYTPAKEKDLRLPLSVLPTFSSMPSSATRTSTKTSQHRPENDLAKR